MSDLLDQRIAMDKFDLRYMRKSPVVIVYVWRTTTVFDTRKSRSDYEQYARNSIDSNRFFRSVGHAGIGIYYKGEFLYKGFGPLNTYKEIKLTNPITSFNGMFYSYEADVKENMKSIPECQINLYNLDFEKVYNFLQKPTGSWDTYNLYTKNCSTFVLKALMVGSGGIKPTMWKRSKRFWGNMFDIVMTFAWLLPNINAQQRMYSATKFGNDSNPILAMDHIFKTMGGDTPDAVLRYAHFLENHLPYNP